MMLPCRISLGLEFVCFCFAGIREFHCKLCNYKGVTQSDLNRHMKSQIHMMKAQNECRLCGEGFVSPKNMDKHVAVCQGVKLENLGKTDDD